MVKLISLLYIFFVSFSFGQSKNKENTPNSKSTSKTEVIVCGCKGDPIYRDENTIYSSGIVDERPEILGRITKEQFIKNNFRTPFVNGKKITGKVYVNFIVEKDGTITNISIIRHVGHGTGEEAKRVLQNMPRWKPAKIGGKIVRCSYSMPMVIP